MDITKELKEIELSEKHAEKVLANILEQKEELRKKEYLIKIIFASKIISTRLDLFNEDNIAYLDIGSQQEYNGNYKAVFIQLDYDKKSVLEFIDLKKGEYTLATKLLRDLSDCMGEYYLDLCSDLLKKNKFTQIKLDNNIKKNFLNIFLSDELKQIALKNKFDESSTEIILQDIISQTSEIKDKEHILEVISIGNKLQSLVKEKFFKELGVEAIELTCDYDYDDGYRVISGSVFTNNGFTEDANESQKEFFEEFFSYITELDSSFISDDLINTSVLKLNNNVKEQVINLFLSPRLKTILDYNRMKADLPDNNENNSKKLKI